MLIDSCHRAVIIKAARASLPCSAVARPDLPASLRYH
jgi:hypothetical protein